MEIDLRKVKTVCISRAKSTERQQAIIRHMETLGMENWSIFDGDTVRTDSACGIRGCALSHLAVLSSHNFEQPLLILEDDAEPTEEWNPVIDVPDETEGVYLGYSCWWWSKKRIRKTGRLTSIEDYIASPITDMMKNLSKGTGELERLGKWLHFFNKGWYRISGMLATHAILYLSKEYAKTVCQEIERRLNSTDLDIACDVAMANVQEKHIILAPKKPYIFQGPQDTNYAAAWTSCASEKYPGGLVIPLDDYIKNFYYYSNR